MDKKMHEETKNTIIEALKLTEKQRKKLVEMIDEEQEIYYDNSVGGCDALWIASDLTKTEDKDYIEFDEDEWLESAIAYVKMYN